MSEETTQEYLDEIEKRTYFVVGKIDNGVRCWLQFIQGKDCLRLYSDRESAEEFIEQDALSFAIKIGGFPYEIHHDALRAHGFTDPKRQVDEMVEALRNDARWLLRSRHHTECARNVDNRDYECTCGRNRRISEANEIIAELDAAKAEREKG